jgi:hypothetical protein
MSHVVRRRTIDGAMAAAVSSSPPALRVRWRRVKGSFCGRFACVLPIVIVMSAAPLPRMTAFTLAVIPEANTVKDACGLPFGCIVRPLIPIIAPGPERIIPPNFSDISRCESCGAYISPFCRFEQRLWRCAMCGQTNDLSTR